MSDPFESEAEVSTPLKVTIAFTLLIVVSAVVFVIWRNEPYLFEGIKYFALLSISGLVLYVVGWYVNRALGLPFSGYGRRSSSWRDFESAEYDPEHPFDLGGPPTDDGFGGSLDVSNGQWYSNPTLHSTHGDLPSPFDAYERWKCGYCGTWNQEEQGECGKCRAKYESRVLTSVEQAETNSRRRTKS
ncbi:MAG: hypothetical protein KF812_12815 [Fimbriimonadaceae bacterium]|nr:hypothetical protein [Fimbriimonadaceae bacterium]